MTTPLVLVHGGAHGAWCWQPTIPLLAGPVVAVDLPPQSIRGVPAPDPLPPDLASPGGEVEVIELDTGHDVMVSAPVTLAEVLDEIANRTES